LARLVPTADIPVILPYYVGNTVDFLASATPRRDVPSGHILH